MSRVHLSEYVVHVTIFSWMFTIHTFIHLSGRQTKQRTKHKT